MPPLVQLSPPRRMSLRRYVASSPSLINVIIVIRERRCHLRPFSWGGRKAQAWIWAMPSLVQPLPSSADVHGSPTTRHAVLPNTSFNNRLGSSMIYRSEYPTIPLPIPPRRVAIIHQLRLHRRAKKSFIILPIYLSLCYYVAQTVCSYHPNCRAFR